MKLAIMQPYFFPYIGYWQLVNMVDVFVIYDDVNYIKSGWINRNKVLINKKETYYTLPLQNSSSNKKINEVILNKDPLKIKKMLKSIKESYARAPYFDDVYLLVENILLQEEDNLARFLINSINQICCYLEIDTQILISSDLSKQNGLKGEAKVINICKTLNADEYINSIGGQELYSKINFENNGVKLGFLRSKCESYQQFNLEEHIGSLSIIDVMMFNDKATIQNMLKNYEVF